MNLKCKYLVFLVREARETHFNDISERLNNNGSCKSTNNISPSNDDQNEELTMNKCNQQNVDKNISFNSNILNNFDQVRSVNATVPMRSENNFYNKNQAATKLYGEILSRTETKLQSNTTLFKRGVMENSNLSGSKANELRHQKLNAEDNIRDIKPRCIDQMSYSLSSSERLPPKKDDHWRRSVFTAVDSTEDYGFAEHEETTRYEVD